LQLKFGAIAQTIFLDASPDEVYEALLDPKKHSEFTGSPATTSEKQGATFTAWDGYISGRNIELVKGRRIVQEWKTTEWPMGYPYSRLELDLAPRGGGTELEMVHSKVPAEQLGKYSGGWKESYWEPLREYFSSRGARPRLSRPPRRPEGSRKRRPSSSKPRSSRRSKSRSRG